MPVGMGKRKSELIQKLLVCTLLVTYNGSLVHSATVYMGRPFWSSTNLLNHQSVWLLKSATLLISNIIVGDMLSALYHTLRTMQSPCMTAFDDLLHVGVKCRIFELLLLPLLVTDTCTLDPGPSLRDIRLSTSLYL